MKIDIIDSLIKLLGGAPSLARDWSGPYITYVRNKDQVGSYTRGGTKFESVLVHPANSQAKAFADAVCELLAARVSFESKKDENHGYGDPEAEEVYNRAADKLWNIVRG
jgi:hypothetical protein